LNYVGPKEAINRLLRRKPSSKQQVPSEDPVSGIVDNTTQESGPATSGATNGNGSNANGQGQQQVDTVQLREVLEDTAASVSTASARTCPGKCHQCKQCSAACPHALLIVMFAYSATRHTLATLPSHHPLPFIMVWLSIWQAVVGQPLGRVAKTYRAERRALQQQAGRKLFYPTKRTLEYLDGR
jgi:ferredoxin